MKLSVICFTRNGYNRINELKNADIPDVEIQLFCKCSAMKEQCEFLYVEEPVDEWAGEQFSKKNALLFIGAAGIAVRAIASSVRDKLSDSPVLVMDDNGRFVIPILSGHVGGANELAEKLSDAFGAVPVITTSTDVNGRFAIDVFAKKNGLFIKNKEGIAKVTSKVLEGESISILIGRDILVDEDKKALFLKKHGEKIRLFKSDDEQATADVFIGDEEKDKALLYLKPKKYVLGAGCRRDKSGHELIGFVTERLLCEGIDTGQICLLSSADIKKDEEGLIKLADHLGVPFKTYSADELNSVPGDFSESEFVREKVGCGSVSERAAVKGSDGSLILKKQAYKGMTLAVAQKKWRLEFNE